MRQNDAKQQKVENQLLAANAENEKLANLLEEKENAISQLH